MLDAGNGGLNVFKIKGVSPWSDSQVPPGMGQRFRDQPSREAGAGVWLPDGMEVSLEAAELGHSQLLLSVHYITQGIAEGPERVQTCTVLLPRLSPNYSELLAGHVV